MSRSNSKSNRERLGKFLYWLFITVTALFFITPVSFLLLMTVPEDSSNARLETVSTEEYISFKRDRYTDVMYIFDRRCGITPMYNSDGTIMTYAEYIAVEDTSTSLN